MKSNLSEIDIVILCGGLGKRLQPVLAATPKVLAPIGSKPFLEVQIRHLVSFGFCRFILSVGYQKKEVIDFASRLQKQHPALLLKFSEEISPLGTGGAVKQAASVITSQTFFVVNGDTVSSVDLRLLYQFHHRKKTLLSIALAKAHDGRDYGNVVVDHQGKIISYQEKTSAKASYVSAGAYVMERQIFSYMKKKNFSIEHDFFPKMIQQAPCFGYVGDHVFHDIGTPERYRESKIKISEIIQRDF